MENLVETQDEPKQSLLEKRLLKQYENAGVARRNILVSEHEKQSHTIETVLEKTKQSRRTKVNVYEEPPSDNDESDELRELSHVRSGKHALLELIDAHVHMGLTVLNVAPYDAIHSMTTNWLSSVAQTIVAEFDDAYASQDPKKIVQVLLCLLATRECVSKTNTQIHK